MPKLKNLTAQDIDGLVDKADGLFFEIKDAADMLRKGAVDAIPEAVGRANTLIGLSRIAADMAGAILTRKMMFDDRADLKTKLEAQLKAGQ